MKSPLAQKIALACVNSGLACEVNDHRLFSFDSDFDKQYENAFKNAAESKADVVILVVGEGHDSTKPFRVEAEPAIPGVAHLFRLLG